MDLMVLAPIGAVLALIFAFYKGIKISKMEEGTQEVKDIAKKIRIGANAYLKRQYKGVGLFFIGMFVVLLVLGCMGYVSIFVPFAFITGGGILRLKWFHWNEDCYISQ